MFKFERQTNENIIKVYRQTKLVLLKYIGATIIAIVVPTRFLSDYDLAGKWKNFLLLWSGLWLVYLIHKFLLWRLNCYVLTNQRLINLIFFNTIHKKVIEAPLERILNISFEIKGFFPAIFNYGDIHVQIVGLTEPLVFTKISYPARTKDFLWNAHNKFLDKSSLGSRSSISRLQQEIGYQGTTQIKNGNRDNVQEKNKV